MRIISIKYSRILGLSVLMSLALGGCASSPNATFDSAIVTEIQGYEASLPPNHPEAESNIFYLPESVKQYVRDNFSGKNKHRNATRLAEWLIDKSGHSMTYDIEANLTPAQAFAERRGNCLSFTLLLIELSSELDTSMSVNQVDMPDMWGQDGQNDLIFYRHVNAIYKTPYNTQIFDLAIDEYRAGYPQRIIKKRESAGLLFSNIGIQHLQRGNIDSAFHYLKLSASLFPKNSDMWINLAATYKHVGDLSTAEKIYLHAFSIDDKNSLAASNLERLYRAMGRPNDAKRFAKLAHRARQRNPYLQYQNAVKHFENKEYRKARKFIKRAIQLHDNDPKFYALSALVKQQFNRYHSAILDLQKAHKLSTDQKQRERYYNKVLLVAKRAEEWNKNRQRSSSLNYSGVNFRGSSL